MSEKIYCGNGKEKVFDNGGSIVKVCLDLDLLHRMFDQYGFTTNGGKKMIKVDVCKGREIDKYDNTHYVTVDTFTPNSGGQQNSPKPASNQNSGSMDNPTYGKAARGSSFDDGDPNSDIPF